MADPSSRPAAPSGTVPQSVARASPPGEADRTQPDPVPVPESFEAAVAELEELVRRMEGGTLALEESLLAYRRGASLVSWCRKSLADVQQQVRILEADLLRPFEAQPCAPQAPDAPR